jgi:ABC-type phosphate/phosphonate transport system substrate-binding protein
MRKLLTTCIAATALVAFALPALAGETIKFVIMAAADPKKEGAKFETLAKYLQEQSAKFDKVELRIAKGYPEAAQLFKSGEADGLVAGSFVASIFLGQGVAKPVARPVPPSGVWTYKALVVAKEGTKPFAGLDDFKGKKVTYSKLASAGEIFVRALLKGAKPESVMTPLPAPNHGAALNALVNGEADYAVIKNTIFDPAKNKGFAVVGGDQGENPDGTIILSNQAHAKYAEEIKAALLKVEGSSSPTAAALKTEFGAKGFMAATMDDFKHTNDLVKRAGIDPAKFNFEF